MPSSQEVFALRAPSVTSYVHGKEKIGGKQIFID
jgi:hypothetical protein